MVRLFHKITGQVEYNINLRAAKMNFTELCF